MRTAEGVHLVLCLFGRRSERSSSLTRTTSTLINASSGMGGTTPSSLKAALDGMSSSLTNAPGGIGGTVPLPSSSLSCSTTAAALFAAACPSGDRATHSAASSAVAKQPRLTALPPHFNCA
eukprot:scaffold14957_cov67-Phaeocystis_antarctica.AAC.5